MDKNFLTEHRDNYIGSWPRALKYIFFTTLFGFLISLFFYFIGVIKTVSWELVLGNVVGTLLLVIAAYLIKKNGLIVGEQ